MDDKIRYRILIVDDDARLRELLSRFLHEQGYSTQAVEDSATMNRSLSRERFDLVVLDLMLPGEDGLSICRRLRQEGNTIPIIMLTAKGNDEDRIVGLDMGADDYIGKPFNPRELLARIQAVMRRQPVIPPGSPAAKDEIISFGNIHIDLGARKLKRDGEDVPITTAEFSLLKVLVQNSRLPLARGKLTEMARGREYEAFDRAIDVQISRLRKLIEDDPANPRYIQTVWGFGYVFVPDGSKHHTTR
jgi:two-component system phosphate regulon response regulator OmpR